jgi:hypothetical protein
LQQFNDIGNAMLTMSSYAIGGVDLKTMMGCTNANAAILLSMLYQFAVGIVLMSMLTGGYDCCYNML